jgi:hypothetical protein
MKMPQRNAEFVRRFGIDLCVNGKKILFFAGVVIAGANPRSAPVQIAETGRRTTNCDRCAIPRRDGAAGR